MPPAADPTLRLGWNLPRETLALLREARGNGPVWLAILGLSWFWTIGATLLAAFPVIAKETLAADGSVVTLLLTVFALGVGTGSIACAKVLKGEVSPRLVPWAALGITVRSRTFHGRDLFAPVAGRLAAGALPFEAAGRVVEPLATALVPTPRVAARWSPRSW